MSNKVDKLFKDKLEGHTLQPSAQAWEKVEAHLAKKNKMVLWLRVAAAVAMLGLLTFAVQNWRGAYEDTKKELVKEEKKEPVQSNEEKTESAPATVDEQKEIKKEKVQPKKVQPKIITPVAEQPVEQIAVVPQPEVVSQPEIIPESPVQSKPLKGITLTYSLPAIRKTEPAPDEPVVAETKKTGLERVLEIAKDVKNGDNPLGDLREAKNEILALEFRKDKNKKE